MEGSIADMEDIAVDMDIAEDIIEVITVDTADVITEHTAREECTAGLLVERTVGPTMPIIADTILIAPAIDN